MPKFVIYTREIVCTRHTVVTNTIASAKRTFLDNGATEQDFEVEETLACWIVDPDGKQTPIDEIEMQFAFPLSAALGGGQIVVMAPSLAEALAKVDHEIKALGVAAVPPAPKSIAIKSEASAANIPVKSVMSDKELADGLTSVDLGPLAFQYFRVKPCIENYDGDIDSFNSDEERDEALKGYVLQLPRTFYTLYGVAADERELAIGDFSLKSVAPETMNAILAPMAKVRDQLTRARHLANRSAATITAVNILDSAANQVVSDLEDFINQCSNGERA